MTVVTFDEAYEDSSDCNKKHLLIGNGFSISAFPDIFHYGSLFSAANFEGNERIKMVFEALQTQDFEEVIKSLEKSAAAVPPYIEDGSNAPMEMIADANVLKEILIKTIAGNHPKNPNSVRPECFEACRGFLSRFLVDGRGYVFTLNYDLLLYWAIMHGADDGEGPEQLNASDGFGNDEMDPDAEYVVWQGETSPHSARVHFLHGALHLFDDRDELKKFTWIRKDIPLIEQARDAISEGAYPLFVSEGSSIKKKEKIRHNAYLYQCFKVFSQNSLQKSHAIFVFGHSLADTDNHIFQRIGRGKCKKLYVSIFGDPDSKTNKQIMARANRLALLRRPETPLNVTFYDAESARIWG